MLAAAALVVVLRPGTADAAGLANLPSCAGPGQACVAVKVVDNGHQVGSLTFTTASDLAGSNADVDNQGYAVPGSSPVSVSSGTSVAKLITMAGAAGGGPGFGLGDVQFAEVDGPDGYGRHVLTKAELQPPGQNNQAPVLYPNPQGNANDYVNFVRANRGGADDQLQPGPDLGFFQSDQDAALEIVVHLSGQSLDVSVAAAPVAGSNGRSFDLSSDPGGGNLSTTWVYPDSTTSADATPRYTFPATTPAGSYPVAVAVENPGDGSFGWGRTTVQVGAAPTASSSPTAAGTGGHGHGHQGATHGHHGGSTDPGNGSGHGGPGTASPTSAPTQSATPQPSGPPTLAPSLPTTAPTSSLYVPASGGTLTAPSKSPSKSSSTPAATPTPTPTPTPAATPTTPSGTAVQGVLLTDADDTGPTSVQPSQNEILDVPAPTASAAPALDPSFRIDPLVWLAVGGVVLLLAGVASESDRVRRVLGRRVRRWARIRA